MQDVVIWKTKCPRCGGTSKVNLNPVDNPPVVKCGECLFNDQEIVDLICTQVEDER